MNFCPPRLERLPADSDPVKLVELIARDGGLVVEGLIDRADAARLEADFAPAAERRRPGFNADHDDAFYGANTIRVQALFRRSDLWVDRILLNPALLSIADAVLLPHCGDYWMSQSELIYLGPGQDPQELHRDDMNWPLAATIPGIDLQVACLVALGDYDAEVGATYVVPGSHSWDATRVPTHAEAVQVELTPGDALVYTGSLWHGGGANSTADRWRKALYISYLVGWLTPEEAVAVSVPEDLSRTLPARARELLGRANIPSGSAANASEAALQLWQMDADVLHDTAGAFHHR